MEFCDKRVARFAQRRREWLEMHGLLHASSGVALQAEPTSNRPTANVCSPGTNYVQNGKLITQHCNNSTSKTFHGDQWVTVEIEVHGSKLIRHFVNGEKVFEYSQPQLDDKDPLARKLIQAQGGKKLLSSGSISLQSESHPIEFRKVELKKLEE